MASAERDIAFATAHEPVTVDPLSTETGEASATELVGRVAQLLFTAGQTSEGVSHAVRRLGHALGQPVELFLRWGDLTVAPRESSAWRTAAEPFGVDIRRVVAAEEVVDALCAATVTRAAALSRLRGISELPPASLARFAIMAAAGAAALSIIFGAKDPATLVLVAASAGFGAVLRRAESRVSHNPFVQPFSAALLAGLVAGAALLLGAPVSVRLVAVCPCMVLVPGPHLLNGSIDLARGRVPLGTARITFASVIVVAISAGLLTGLGMTTQHLPSAGSSSAVPILVDVGAAGVAVAAYGSFFNMPWRLLPAPIGIGMAAHAVHWLALQSGAGVPMAAFWACLVVGCTTAPLAWAFRLPFGATAFASVVSLMPGLYLFEVAATLMDLVGEGAQVKLDTLGALSENAAIALGVLFAMTAGLIAPKMVFDGTVGFVDVHRERAGHMPEAAALDSQVASASE